MISESLLCDHIAEEIDNNNVMRMVLFIDQLLGTKYFLEAYFHFGRKGTSFF